MDLDENRLYRLRQIYINPKAKFGPHPVAGIEFNNEYNALWVSLPARMVKAVEDLLSRKDAIQAINRGECGFRIRNFHSEKYDKDGTALDFVNITADAPVSRTLSHPVPDSSHSMQGTAPSGEVHSQKPPVYHQDHRPAPESSGGCGAGGSGYNNPYGSHYR